MSTIHAVTISYTSEQGIASADFSSESTHHHHHFKQSSLYLPILTSNYSCIMLVNVL